MNPRYRAVAGRANHRCEYCHAPEVAFNLPFEVEHVLPDSLGRDDSDSNTALSCRSCNLYKSNYISSNDPETGESTRLFHPRTDKWEEHFAVACGQASIQGRTPIGRATIVLLRMNSPRQLDARRQWEVLQLFP